MASVALLVERMRQSPRNVRYSDLVKVCDEHLGPPRTTGGSHAAYRTPWPGDPRVNIQNDHGKAKVHQVQQVLAAVDKMDGRAR